jgi:hypothetical protein
VTPHRSASDPPAGGASAELPTAEVAFLAGPVEARLVALLHEADAFATHLRLTAADAARLLAARAGEVASVVIALRAALADAAMLAPGTDADETIERLLALLARVAPLRQRRRIAAHARRVAEAAAELHGSIVATVAQAHQRLERAQLQDLRRFERAHDELQVQMRAAAAVERRTRDLRGAALDERKQRLAGAVSELSRRLAEGRARLAAQRERSAVQWRELDAELQSSVEAVGADLDRLLG